MVRFTDVLLIATFTLSEPVTAAADPLRPSAAELDRAADLFKRAKALHAGGKLEDARGLYTQAWALHRSPDIAANLAASELALGRHRDAAEHFDFALGHLLAGTTAEQKARLVDGLSKAKKEVASLRFEVEPAGAVIVLDGKSLGAAPVADTAYAEPGERKLEVTKDGYESHIGSFTVGKGETKTVKIVLDAKGDPAAAGGAGTGGAGAGGKGAGTGAGASGGSTGAGAGGAAGGGGSKSAIPAYAALGVGVVGLGAGVGFLLAASGKENDKDALLQDIPGSNKCGSGTASEQKCAEVTSLADDAKRFRTFGYVGFGVAAAGGVLAFLLWPRTPAPEAGAVVVPGVTAAGPSIQVYGNF